MTQRNSSTANKLTSEQRATLLEWLAADYDWRLIKQWFEEREWPQLSRAAITYYRRTRFDGIAKIRAERYSQALDSGLAQKAERVERLKLHADKLEAIKWQPDKNGRLWNEKAWRETLRDIAEEMGERKPSVEVHINIIQELERRAIDAGIDIRSDPILLALFTALGADIDHSTADRATDASEASRAVVDPAALPVSRE